MRPAPPLNRTKDLSVSVRKICACRDSKPAKMKRMESRVTNSAGGVVLSRFRHVLVVNQRGRSWSLPKGHIEPGEDALTAARREIYEESGLQDLELIRPLGSYTRHKIGLNAGEEGPEVKRLTFFLFRSMTETLKPIDPDNPEARWVDPQAVSRLLTHAKDKEFFEQVLREYAPEFQ
jgi:8-oxo-dGTP pyrophosphatase MutT (NUDIX family)